MSTLRVRRYLDATSDWLDLCSTFHEDLTTLLGGVDTGGRDSKLASEIELLLTSIVGNMEEVRNAQTALPTIIRT